MELGMTPNDRLERADDVAWAGTGQVDDVVLVDGELAVATGNVVTVHRADGADQTTLPDRVTAMAATDNGIVVAVSGHGLLKVNAGRVDPQSEDVSLRHNVTALLALPGGELLATVGSSERDLDGWVWDLFEQKATGSIHRIDADGRIVQSRQGLPWAAGLAEGMEGPGSPVLLSLAHAHRIEYVDPTSLQSLGTFLEGLPSYPWRISRAPGRDSWWVSMPLVRSRLTELMLGEKAFLSDMMATVPTQSWYGPSMAGGSVYREPLQLGGLRVLGQLKPWAPPRSYGLVVEVDAFGRVLRSLHSRAGGTTHGVVAAVEHEGSLWVAARSRSGLVRVTLSEDEVVS